MAQSIVLRSPARRALAALAGAALLGVLALRPDTGRAADWRVDSDASQVEITYLEDGAPQPGAFTRFRGEGSFDPDRPERAALKLTFETASIALTDGFRSEFVQTEAWFDSKRYPVATFVLTRLTLIADDRYRAEGVLTIKTVSRPIVSELALRLEERQAIAEGALRFDRLDFKLGDTIGGFLIEIGRPIDVRFRLRAERQ